MKIFRRLMLLGKNEKGIALVVALLVMAALLLIGATAVMTTTTDLKISSNYKQSENAFYSAEAGIQEARERLKGSTTSNTNYVGDPSTSADPLWCAYILTSTSWNPAEKDSSYSSSYRNYIPTSSSHTNTTLSINSLQNTMKYYVKIRHKMEYDAEQDGHTSSSTHYFDNDGSTTTHSSSSPGNIIYYGYGDSSAPTTAKQFTTSSATDAKPVEIITAYGVDGSAQKLLEMEVVRPTGPPVVAAIYAKNNVTGNGSSMFVSGNDNCGVAAAKPPIYALSPAEVNTSGHPTLEGNPSTWQSGSTNIDIASNVNNLKGSATIKLTDDQSGGTIGSTSNYVTCYSNTSNPYNVNGLKLQNLTGYGILVVEGDLTLGGGFSWNGIILVTGTLVFNGGGSGINIRGAVLAEQTVDINGGLDIRYDSCQISNAVNTQSLKVLQWRQR